MKKISKLKSVTADRYLTVEEASDELGIKSSVVRNYLSLDKLTTYKFKTLTLISRREIEEWRERREQ